MSDKKPKIVAFVCNWCSYAGADKAGALKLKYSENVKLIRVMCSGRVDPSFVLESFRKGADGVMVLACHEGDCHYRSGNTKARNRMVLLEKMLPGFGIDKKRLKFDYVSASEAEKFQVLANEMTDEMKKLGPLTLNGFVDKTEAIEEVFV